MGFGEKLSLLRKQRGMTQLDLAEALDISRQAVSRWEQGVSEPSTENLVRIGKLFGVPVDTLVNGGAQSPPEVEAQAAEAGPKGAGPEDTDPEEADPETAAPEEAGDPPRVMPPKPRPRRWLAAAVCAGMVCTLLGMLAGAMLAGGGAAAGVTFGTEGLAINGRTAFQAGEATTNANGCEIPSSILYTDEQGGGNTYLPIEAVSKLLDIPVSCEDGMVYLGYKPSEPSSGSDLIISDSVFTPELLAERPLHRAGAKAGPYTELEPHWPSEDEIEGWNNWTLKDVPMSGDYRVESDFYRPLEGEGYCALSITNTTGRDLVLTVCSPATITNDYFPDTLVPAGETVVRTFYAVPYTGGLSQRGLTFSLACDPVVEDGEAENTVSATVSLVSFTPQ